ncbi:MAG: glycerophosphodiester phosphodiesterase [Alphaproteobacteria bacterium]|nr:glycerophosphodiester phosphodiesterase [Alphaproteobacteria bacterium]
MFFAHRGLVTKDSPENSVTSLTAAYKAGFRGVEFDLWFLDGKFVVKHDEPKGEELPSLRDFLRFGNEMTYWLDFKNLDESNANKAFELTKQEISRAKIDFSKIYFAPFITDYSLAEKVKNILGKNFQFVAFCINKAQIPALENFYQKNQIKFLSVFHELIDADFIKKFSGAEIFAWSVNDLERLKKLAALGVNNFATNTHYTKIFSPFF